MCMSRFECLPVKKEIRVDIVNYGRQAMEQKRGILLSVFCFVFIFFSALHIPGFIK